MQFDNPGTELNTIQLKVAYKYGARYMLYTPERDVQKYKRKI